MFILPLLTVLILGLIIHSMFGVVSFRKTFVLCLIGFGLIALIITEVLSSIHLFEQVFVINLYAVVNLLLIGMYIKKHKMILMHLKISILKKWFYLNLRQRSSRFKPDERESVYYLIFIVLILSVTLLITLVAAPNNYDSMTYHLARVMHWIANSSVNYYATHNDRQLYSGPLAEYIIAQFQIIHGSDRFANLVSWIYGLGCLVAGSLVIKELGSRYKTQLFATVIIATAPEVILQSTSTQNDLVVSFFVISFGYLVLASIKKRHFTVQEGLLLGVTLGLGILTKGTAYVYFFPFLVWYSVELFLHNRAAFIKRMLLIITIGFVVNAGSYLRNYKYFGYPLGEKNGIEAIKNSCPGPKSTASNIVRNLAAQIWSPSQQINQKIYNGVSNFHYIIKQDLNSPCATFLAPMNIFTPIIQLNQHEDNAGNPFQIIYFILAFILFTTYYRIHPSLPRKYLIVVLSGFILFSVAFKWQAGINRLNLPLIVLGSASVVVFDYNKFRNYNLIFASLMLLAAIPPLLFNETRPVFASHFLTGTRKVPSVFTTHRYLQYFSSIQGLETQYLPIVSILNQRKCQNVGLVIGSDAPEYQLWAIDQTKQIKYYHILTADKNDFGATNVCAIVSVMNGVIGDSVTEVAYQNSKFVIVYHGSLTNLYLPQ